MFADDTKLWCTIGQVSDSIPLQNDLRQLEHWTEKWQLAVNPDKCKVMHIGHRHTTAYELQHNGKPRVLDESNEEKDLGVYVSTDLKPSTQCTKSANRAISILRMVKRNFPRTDKDDFAVLYKTYIRPHMEYCIQAWSSQLVKVIQTLEKVQRQATKCVIGMKGKTYEQRLQLLNITTLEKR